MNKWAKFGITNFFTMLRAIGIVCLMPVFKLYGGVATALLSAGCFATDFIDGLLARKLKSSTFFGSLFDAISDKAFLIVNMILLMSITPISIVPILLELGIATIQSIKYQRNMNVQSNIIGKIKMWVAGITVSFSYLLVDPIFINYLGANIAAKVAEVGNLKLFGITLAPLVLSEIATLGSYIKEFVDGKKEKVNEESLDGEEKYSGELENKSKDLEQVENCIENMDMSLKDMLFDHEFYERYKDEGNLKLIRRMAKKKK